MAITYSLIAKNNVTGSAVANITFSGIPATYDDLHVRMSLKADTNAMYEGEVSFYTATSTVAYTRMGMNGASTFASRSTGNNGIYFFAHAASGSTNVWSSTELYIPNYAASTRKQVWAFGGAENNSAATSIGMGMHANSINTVGVISSMTISGYNNIAVGSSVYLYGIKKA